MSLPANAALACPTVDPSKMSLGREFIPSPGSVKTKCDVCQDEVWIGIKQQDAKRTNPDVPVICFICAAKGGPAQHISNLGGKGGYYGPLGPAQQN